MYHIKISKRAQNGLKKIPAIYQQKIARVIKELAVDPMPNGVKKCKVKSIYIASKFPTIELSMK